MSGYEQLSESFTNAQLASALATCGVPFVWHEETSVHLTPEELLTNLARSDEARLRLALIPLLLTHPTFATTVADVYEQLSGDAAITLRFYYTAARLLQKGFASHPQEFEAKVEQLPPLFYPALVNPDEDLHKLAILHAVDSGRSLNWYGSYQHAAQRYLRQIGTV